MTQSDLPERGGRNAAFRFIFAASLMNSISFGLMIPVLPNLIREMVGGSTADAAVWNTLFATIWGVMQLFCGPMLGMLSDRIGRRPVMLISLFGLAVDFLFMALAPNLTWLFIGRIINGMTAASFSTASAYVADVTPPQERAKAFGLMGSAFSFGFLMGPAIGGSLAVIDMRLPFFVAAGLTSLNWLYGLLILPESLPPERRVAKFDWRKANPIGSLKFLTSRADLAPLAVIGFLYQLAHNVLPSIFVLYAGYRYNWTPQMIGLGMMLTGVLGVLVQVFAIGPVVARIGERGALLLGCIGGATGFMLYGFAPTGWAYLASAPVFSLIGFIQPGLQGLMTRKVGSHEQGQLQGANQGLQGISSVLGPAMFGGIFAWSVRSDASLHMPGLAIYVAALLLLAALALGWKVARVPAAVEA